METEVKKQSEKFRDAARELETDDREEAFDRALKRVAKNEPAASPKASRQSD